MPPTSLLRPAELPPFELRSLVPHVFASPGAVDDLGPAPPSQPAFESTAGSPPSVGARLSQFVQTARGAPTQQATPTKAKAAVARAVDGSRDTVWVGTSDGRARTFRLRAKRRRASVDEPLSPGSVVSRSSAASPSGRSATSGSRSSKAKGKEKVEVEADCVAERQLVAASEQGKVKAVERLVLVPRIGKAIVQSEGVVTVHALPTLAPLPPSTFPPVRGVSAFAIDEDQVASPSPPSSSTFDHPPEVTLCVIRRRSISLFRLREGGMGQLRDVPLASSAFHGVLRGSALLLADIEQYSIVNLVASVMTPLLPISQVPLESSQNGSSSRASTAHRPAMAAIPSTDEFLFASHTGSTCLGVFVNSRGEPSRGTIEWPSNPRSVVVVGSHVLALLLNGTVEVHALATGEIVQVVSLPDGLDARSLASVPAGVNLPGGAKGVWKVKTVSIPLYPAQPPPSSSATRADEPPRTPTPSSRSFHRRLLDSPSNSSIVSSSTGHDDRLDTDDPSTSHALVLGKDSVHALTPLTLVAQAEALMSKNRWDDAILLARQTLASSSHPSKPGNAGDQAVYVLQKAAAHALTECRFEDAGRVWAETEGDPRIFVRLLPHLKAGSVARRDEVIVFRGLERFFRDRLTADALVTASLVRNYSPHIRDVGSSSSPTADLRSTLVKRAEAMVRGYLESWRIRRIATREEDESRKVDMVVDTALAELYAESDATALDRLLDEPNDVVLAELDDALLANGRFATMTEVYRRRGQLDLVLESWKRFVDGEWIDRAMVDPLSKIVDHLRSSEDVDRLSLNLVWLATRSPSSALSLLADAKAAPNLDVRATFDSLESVEGGKGKEVAEEYAVMVCARRPNVEGGQMVKMLVERWVGRVKLATRRQEIGTELRARAEEAVGGGGGFLKMMREQAEKADEEVGEVWRTRLKTVLFLGQVKASDLEGVRRELEGMGGSESAFAFERAIVYGKLGLHRPALSLLATTLGDFNAAEVYCVQGGDPLTRSDLSSISNTLGLPVPFLDSTTSRRRKKKSSLASGTAEGRAELLAILFDLGMSTTGEGDVERMTGLLQRHAVHLPIGKLLPSLNESWPMDPTMTKYVVRSVRKSEHERREGQLVKAVRSGLEMEWEVEIGEVRRRMGGHVQTEGRVGGGGSLGKKKEGFGKADEGML